MGEAKGTLGQPISISLFETQTGIYKNAGGRPRIRDTNERSLATRMGTMLRADSLHRLERDLSLSVGCEHFTPETKSPGDDFHKRLFRVPDLPGLSMSAREAESQLVGQGEQMGEFVPL